MKVSVALCTFNGEKYIEKQLKSIINQTVVPDEIMICDDGSTDNTLFLIDKFIKANSNTKINILINENRLKTVKNFEKAISHCTGDWIFLCDQDDIWYPNKVELIMKFIMSQKNTLMVFTNANLIDEYDYSLHSTLWEKWNFDLEKQNLWLNTKNAFKDLIVNDNFVTGATSVISSKLKMKSLPINAPAGYYHDAWFALHASALNGLRFIDESLIQYRIHDLQQVGITVGGNLDSLAIFEDNISYKEFKKRIYKLYPHMKFLDIMDKIKHVLTKYL